MLLFQSLNGFHSGFSFLKSTSRTSFSAKSLFTPDDSFGQEIQITPRVTKAFFERGNLSEIFFRLWEK